MLQEIQLVQGHNNCVVVSTGYNNGTGIAKSTIDKRTVPIAPAMNNENMNINNNDLMKYKKKINYKSNPYTGPQAASIARRNARERNRVKQVNDGFAALRRHLPASVVAALSNGARRGSSKKLSKVDTLKMVVEYIRYLQQLLDDNDQTQPRASQENMENSANEFALRLEDNILTSPYTELPPSPSPSESSSGVSSGYYRLENQDLSPMQEDELLDVISWWQQK